MSQKQAKKHRREQRAKNQQETPERANSTVDPKEYGVRDLEELLKSRGIDRYADASGTWQTGWRNCPGSGML